MDAGRLRERVTLTTVVEAVDAAGGRAQTYQPAVEVWASVRPTRADELVVAGALQGQATYEVTIRHRSGVGASGRIKRESGAELDILSVQPDERRRYIRMVCKLRRQGAVT